MKNSIKKKLEDLLIKLSEIDMSDMTLEEVREYLQQFTTNSQLIDEVIWQSRRHSYDLKRSAH